MSFYGNFTSWISSSNKRVREEPGFFKDLEELYPPTNFSYEIGESTMAKQARVKFTWNPSVSTDAELQVLTVNEDVIELTGVTSEFTIDIPEKTAVHAELYATDGTNNSEAVALDFNTGDLTAPLAPTNFGFEITDVFEA